MPEQENTRNFTNDPSTFPEFQELRRIDLTQMIAETLAYEEAREQMAPFENPYSISNDELDFRVQRLYPTAQQVVRVFARIVEMFQLDSRADHPHEQRFCDGER